MEYIKQHHLWRPLAAITSNDVLVNMQPPLTPLNQSSVINKTLSALAPAITSVAAAATTEDNSDDVWHKIVFSADSNSIFRRLQNDSYFSNFNMDYDLVSASYDNYTGNATNGTDAETWDMVSMVTTAVILGILILATVIVCGVSNRQMRVVGGNITKVNEFPWMAGLSKNGEFYCGGSLITRRHLLTAAHCINGFDIRTISVVLADHDRDGGDRFVNTVIRGIKKAYPHNAFDPFTYNNDIAIIELDGPVTLDHKVQPACLPTEGNVDYAGRLAVVAGWGKTGERETTSPLLRKVAVPVWTEKECYNSGYGEKRISKNMFCAGYPDGKRDACQGDSGGPLHMSNDEGDMEIIGIVSWGRGCARPKLPGIYTKVANYLDWVQDSLNGECVCPPPAHSPRRV